MRVITCHLIISYNGNLKVTKRRPTTVKSGELVLPLTIRIPLSAFAVYLKSAEINVPETQQYQAAVELREEEQP
jgi:hypothetical protein